MPEVKWKQHGSVSLEFHYAAVGVKDAHIATLEARIRELETVLQNIFAELDPCSSAIPVQRIIPRIQNAIDMIRASISDAKAATASTDEGNSHG